MPNSAEPTIKTDVPESSISTPIRPDYRMRQLTVFPLTESDLRLLNATSDRDRNYTSFATLAASIAASAGVGGFFAEDLTPRELTMCVLGIVVLGVLATGFFWMAKKERDTKKSEIERLREECQESATMHYSTPGEGTDIATASAYSD